MEHPLKIDKRPEELKDRILYVPRMTYSGARAFVSAFRSLGLNAELVPVADQRTMELGYQHASGEECLPEIVTLGNFLKIVEEPGFRPDKAAFFMPLSGGPCRFGQYTPFLQKVLRSIGYEDVMVLAPTSSDGYSGLGDLVNELMRTGFRALMGADTLRKMLLKTRPYELNKGDSQEIYEKALDHFCLAVEQREINNKERLSRMRAALIHCRDLFKSVPAKYERNRPLIGIVGEIYCRLNTFSNEELIRQFEEKGAECWISDLTEWIFYVNHQKIIDLKFDGRALTTERLKTEIRDWIQRRDEHALLGSLHEEFHGLEEPESIGTLMKMAEPYLKPGGALGEMIMSVGKAVYYHSKGADGIVDISPFTCMNGIVSESVYPRISSDHDDIPVRNFYFDGKVADREADVEIFVELARSYKARKKIKRVFPPNFN